MNNIASTLALTSIPPHAPGAPLTPQSLIQRSYRDDVPPTYVERFLPLILEMEEENVPVTPCFSDEGINYMHIRHNNLYCEDQER